MLSFPALCTPHWLRICIDIVTDIDEWLTDDKTEQVKIKVMMLMMILKMLSRRLWTL